MTDSSDDITAHKANTPADVAAADALRAAYGIGAPAQARSSAESCDDDQFMDRIEKSLPIYVSSRARLLASAALDDIDSEWRGEDRTYYMARWFDAAMQSSDGGVEIRRHADLASGGKCLPEEAIDHRGVGNGVSVETGRQAADRQQATGAEVAARPSDHTFPDAQPAPDLWRTALEGSNPAIWADSIERTTRTSVVRAADSYGEAMRKAHIDCLYDFEARRLVALLRAVASQTSPATTPTIDSVPSCGQENDFRQASPAVDLGLCDRVVCGACGCREVLAKEVERLTRARSAQAAAVETIDDVPSCGQENDYRRASPQPSSAATGDEPFGWFFECHVGRDEWAEGFSLTKPEDVGTVRNLTPLYRAVPQEAQVRFIPPVGTCAVCKKPPSKDCSICSTLSRPKPSTDR